MHKSITTVLILLKKKTWIYFFFSICQNQFTFMSHTPFNATLCSLSALVISMSYSYCSLSISQILTYLSYSISIKRPNQRIAGNSNLPFWYKAKYLNPSIWVNLNFTVIISFFSFPYNIIPSILCYSGVNVVPQSCEDNNK